MAGDDIISGDDLRRVDSVTISTGTFHFVSVCSSHISRIGGMWVLQDFLVMSKIISVTVLFKFVYGV